MKWKKVENKNLSPLRKLFRLKSNIKIVYVKVFDRTRTVYKIFEDL